MAAELHKLVKEMEAIGQRSRAQALRLKTTVYQKGLDPIPLHLQGVFTTSSTQEIGEALVKEGWVEQGEGIIFLAQAWERKDNPPEEPAPTDDPAFAYFPDEKTVIVSGEARVLSDKQDEIFRYLREVGGRRIVSRRELDRQIWGPSHKNSTVVSVAVGRLRKVIEEDPEHPQRLKPVRGGYVYTDEEIKRKHLAVPVSADDPIIYLPEAHKVIIDGKEIQLAEQEHELLQYLKTHATTRPVSNQEIIDHLLGSIGSVRMTIMRLRRKLEEDPRNPKRIIMIPAVGYLYNPAQIDLKEFAPWIKHYNRFTKNHRIRSG